MVNRFFASITDLLPSRCHRRSRLSRSQRRLLVKFLFSTPSLPAAATPRALHSLLPAGAFERPQDDDGSNLRLRRVSCRGGGSGGCERIFVKDSSSCRPRCRMCAEKGLRATSQVSPRCSLK